MDYTTRQKVICENIVTIHETGKLTTKSYGTVTNVRGDTGGLTYGKHQVSLNSGGLYLMLARYCATPNAKFAADISKWLPAIKAKQTSVVSMPSLRDLLVKAGDDPVMVFTQDSYFDDQYWKPALAFCNERGLDLALALAVVYDSEIHGSLYRVDKMVPQGLDTKTWIAAYVAARRNWLASSSNKLLQLCTYRMDTFKTLFDAGNFDLNPTVFAHGVNAEGTTSSFGRPTDKALFVTVSPSQRIIQRGDTGDDVVDMQCMLIRMGYDLGSGDGKFGKFTEDAVIAFQTKHGLKGDGVVGPATWRALDKADN